MAEAFGTRTSKNLINRLRTSKRIRNSSQKQNLKKPQKTSNAPEPARQHSYQLLQVQPCWDFNNSIIEFRVPVSLALSLCQYVLRPRRGLGQASPSFEAPRLQTLETGPLSSTSQKGKDCYDQDKQVKRTSFWVRFWHLKLI